MITGFNTDIAHHDRIFHVQTEDKGLRNPMVESLIYCGGEIIASRQNPYKALAESDAYSEDEVLRLMELQHQAMIVEITNGKFDDDEPMPFGHNLVTNRSLDEVVLRYLEESCSPKALRLIPVDDEVLREGTNATLRFRLLAENGTDPVAGAEVTITLISTRDRPRLLVRGETGEDGCVALSFEIPLVRDGNQAIVCQAISDGATTELRELVEKARPASGVT